MSDWRLGIDFGTSYTVTAVWRAGTSSVVDIESNGSSRIPSSVYLTEEDKILVGSFAVNQSVFGPERFEPTPKRAIGEGEIFLGDRLVPVTELAAAVFRKVYEESCRQEGGTAPSAIRVTHPADWGETRLGVLREALAMADISTATLIPEPVAAAAMIATQTPPGRHIAVYDFGGGTFDAAVLCRTPEGSFAVAGPPAGRDPLGGEDIDQRIITYIGTVVGETSEAWLTLTNPSDTKSRQDAVGFRGQVQRAKETLSEVSACQLWIPGLERDLQLTRTELEQLIGPDIEATVDTLETAISDAGVAAADLAGIFLVGGSSRIPLVAWTIRQRLGILPMVQGNPKSVVALGAAAWTDALPTPTVPVQAATEQPGAPIRVGSGPSAASQPVSPAAPPTTLVEPETDQWGRVMFRAYLAADVSGTLWPAGSIGLSQLIVDRTDGVPATIRARDEPASVGASIALATQVHGFRAARTPGYQELSCGGAWVFGQPGGVERRFMMVAGGVQLMMVERYLVTAGRAFVIAFPATAAQVADTFVFGESPEPGLYRSRFEFPCPSDWAASEQLTIKRNGSNHSIIAEHTRFAVPVTAEPWLQGCLARLQARLERPVVVGRARARVLSGLEGEIVSLRSTTRGSPVLTKLGVACCGREAFSMAISLPHREQSQFATMARQMSLSPAVVAVRP